MTVPTVPAGWRGAGHRPGRRAAARPATSACCVLAWADASAADDDADALELALAYARHGGSRACSRQADLHDLAARVDNAQHLANMGDYDWHIPTDTNRWSDQLFRIYGHEPQSFNAPATSGSSR